MTFEEAAKARDEARRAAEERATKDRQLSPQQRAAENATRNAERKQQREKAETVLSSGKVNFQDVFQAGGTLGRKLEREIRRFEQTGRVSSWLAGETLKTEAAQNAAQKSAFSRAVTEVISTTQTPINTWPNLPYRAPQNRKPEIKAEGGVAPCIGFNLYVKTVGTPPNTIDEVWVGVGTINGELPSGFDPSDGKFVVGSGSGYVWVEIEIDPDNGEIEATNFEGGRNIPENTDTKFIYTLGYYEYDAFGNATVTNYGCGGITAVICRNWFATQSPFYGLTSITRSET